MLSASTLVRNSYDVAVVGAGILGLATARELLIREPRLKLLVLEKESSPGQHQTGHNSGVIHSGIYYAPGSAKARLCVTGARLMQEYCDERRIRYKKCGKLIIAVDESELGRLDALETRGVTNGIAGVTRLDAAGIVAVEPHAVGLAALHVASTAIVDFAEVTKALVADVEALGGRLATHSMVTDLRPVTAGVVLRTNGGPVECGRVVVCAGLDGDAVAHRVGGSNRMRIVPFRGRYYRLPTHRRELVRGLIYPVPDPGFPFLGVHFTTRIDGDVWLGPNAVLALAKEGYHRRDIEIGHVLSVIGFPGFRKLAFRHWRIGAAELIRDLSKRRFYSTLKRYIPQLRLEDLVPGPSGVRAQALDANGTLVDDFWFESVGRVLLVRNAPSPAATAALALAGEIADRALIAP